MRGVVRSTVSNDIGLRLGFSKTILSCCSSSIRCSSCFCFTDLTSFLNPSQDKNHPHHPKSSSALRTEDFGDVVVISESFLETEDFLVMTGCISFLEILDFDSSFARVLLSAGFPKDLDAVLAGAGVFLESVFGI